MAEELNNNVVEETKSENEYRKIRIEKLEALQQAGNDPFQITVAEQTATAQEILDNATNEANEIRMGAMGYADDQLRSIEDVLTNSIETSKARTESLVNALQGFLDVVTQNRLQLFPADEEENEQDAEKTETESNTSEKTEVSGATEEPEITNISLSDEDSEE